MSKPKGLVPISMATLLPGAVLGIEVFVREALGLPPQKLFDAAEVIDGDKLEKYSLAGVRSVFICAEDRPTYQEYLQRNWCTVLDDESCPMTSKLCVMSEVVRGVMDNEFSTDITASIVTTSNQFAKTAVQLISRNEIALEQLFEVLHHDYGTFTHSTNVSLYCVLLAKELGLSPEELEEVAVGGLLHDLGKLEIDTRIINKPGPLTKSEMEIMRRHPSIAFERLVDREDVTFGQLMMAYQHHERVNGKGYPCGITDAEIHPFAKICAVVDVFEALTSQRPYRRPLELTHAAQLIWDGQGTEYDVEIASKWIDIVKKGELSHVQ
jgi:HD-GYP domain-containing protein (c-di-GMP phosphodiesterase class II)